MYKEINILCVKQPFSWLIVSGVQNIENRSWNTNYRGELYISTSKTPYPDEDEIIAQIEKQYKVKIPSSQLRYGGIIGKVELVDVVTESQSKWHHEGFFGFVLRKPKLIRFMPIKSERGVFTRRMEVD